MLGRGAFSFIGAVALLFILAVPPEAEPNMEPEEMFRHIAEAVPQFGGAWIEGDASASEKESLHIWLTVTERSAERDVRRLLSELGGTTYSHEAAVVHDADYTWRQLSSWFDQAHELLILRGSASLDLDERRNRVVFAIQDPASQKRAIQSILAKHGVPTDAVIIEAGTPEEALQKETSSSDRSARIDFFPLLVILAVACTMTMFGLLWRFRANRRAKGHE